MRSTINIEATKSTPEVSLDTDSGVFRMHGVCIPEDSASFFNPIIDELNLSMPAMQRNSIFTFNLKYFNSSSLKGIYFILKIIDDANKVGKNIKVDWIVDNDDEFMRDSALTFSSLVKTTIRVKRAA